MPEPGVTARAGTTTGWVRMYLAPIATLLAALAIAGGLVLGGVVQGQAERAGPEEAPTTVPTVIIEP